MATEKKINSRIQQKHDVAANWAKATNFIPKKGEIIIYDAEYNASGEETQAVRFKIGDGSKTVNNLPFAAIDYSSDIEALKQKVANNSTAIGALQENTVPKTRKINNKALSSDITLYPTDVGVDETTFPGLKKTGTVTGVKMNGTTKNPSSGVVDLGTVITAHQSIKSINTNNTAAQAVNTSEAIAGSGTINLHKIAKTGNYKDLLNKPTLGTAAEKNTGTSSGNIPILDSNGKLVDSVIPAVAITDTYVIDTEEEMLALSAQKGDIAIRSDLNKSYVLQTTPASTLANWKELLTPTDTVLSVNGQTGTVELTASDVKALPSSTKYAASSEVGGAATSANKVNSNLIVKLNSGATEGTNLFTFNGSAAKTINITPSAIGAAASSHGTHVTADTVKAALGTGSGTSKYLREDGTWQIPPNTATAADNILDGSNSGTQITYAPYTSQQSKLSFDSSSTEPTRSDRLNLNGHLHATKLYSGGKEVLTSYQSIKSLNTNNTAAQTVNASEAIAGSGTINLHKVAKTGSYNDLSNKPTFVSSVNGSSGAITNVAKTDETNTFTSSQILSRLSDETQASLWNYSGCIAYSHWVQGSSSEPRIGIGYKNSGIRVFNGTTETPAQYYDVTMPSQAGQLVTDTFAKFTGETSGIGHPYRVFQDEAAYATYQSGDPSSVKYTSQTNAALIINTDANNRTAFVDGRIDNKKNGTKYELTLPTKTGTLALTSDIPTVNNGTLTIQKNGTKVQTFTANQSSSVTANITVPTKVSELTNDSGYTTNKGTVTSVSVKMNGASKGTVTSSGTIDLGTVITAHQDISGKLDKTTYEVNKTINFGRDGALYIGKFKVYDTNVTFEITSTTSVTYSGKLVIAAQNYVIREAKVYGDAANTVTPNIYIKPSSESDQYIEVYFKPESWSKNVVHIYGSNIQAAPTDVCTNVPSVPSTATLKPKNALPIHSLSGTTLTITM